jgi:hypothetical protein
VVEDAPTLRRKLGIQPGARVALVGAPDGFAEALGVPPVAMELGAADAPGVDALDLDVIVCFAVARAALAGDFPHLVGRLAPTGGLWICWPKRASRVPTDLSDDVVREIGLGAGLVDNKVCAVDAVWSGQRFVVRVADRVAWGRARGTVA